MKDYLYRLAAAVQKLTSESHDSHLFALEVSLLALPLGAITGTGFSNITGLDNVADKGSRTGPRTRMYCIALAESVGYIRTYGNNTIAVYYALKNVKSFRYTYYGPAQAREWRDWASVMKGATRSARCRTAIGRSAPTWGSRS